MSILRHCVAASSTACRPAAHAAVTCGPTARLLGPSLGPTQERLPISLVDALRSGEWASGNCSPANDCELLAVACANSLLRTHLNLNRPVADDYEGPVLLMVEGQPGKGFPACFSDKHLPGSQDVVQQFVLKA